MTSSLFTLLLLGLITVFPGWSQQANKEAQSGKETIYCCGGVISQVVDGGSWKTTINLVNFEQGPATYTLRFYNNAGQPMFLPTDIGVVSTISGVLPLNGSRVTETQGIQAVTQEGWAQVDTNDHIGGFAVFRLKVNANTPAVEVTSPVDTSFDNTFKMPFDHINAVAGIAIVNPSHSTITVVIIFRDENGAVSRRCLSVGAPGTFNVPAS